MELFSSINITINSCLHNLSSLSYRQTNDVVTFQILTILMGGLYIVMYKVHRMKWWKCLKSKKSQNRRKVTRSWLPVFTKRDTLSISLIISDESDESNESDKTIYIIELERNQIQQRILSITEQPDLGVPSHKTGKRRKNTSGFGRPYLFY